MNRAKLFRHSSPGAAANVLVRLIVGLVFLNEGTLKFLDPAGYAAGRFATIGIPAPEFFGPLVAIVETLGGILLILGWATRPAALVLLVNITVAIFTTKIPILLGHGFLGFTLTKLGRYGVLGMMHAARTDFAMWFGLLFLIIAGPGRWALDFRTGSPARKP
jgi:uncharacterized membrane protein YphA (DoxX/SURF4 family)